jgi:RimJ/RimL family protein N-acetyltransferase
LPKFDEIENKETRMLRGILVCAQKFHLTVNLRNRLVFTEECSMEIVSLEPALEPIFWEHVNQDIPHYYFFAFDWKHNREKTEILLVLDHEHIDGMMLVYDRRVVQLRGSTQAAEALLQRLDLEKVELQSLMEDKRLVLKKYKPTLKQSQELVLMLLHKGKEKLCIEHPVLSLDASNSEKIAAIMRDADLEYWVDVTGQGIMEGINKGAEWFGVKVNNELVSIGMMRLTEWAGLVGIVATQEANRNQGYATSVVSKFVKQIMERLPLAMIYVLADNLPAIRTYKKVGFEPYRTYFFMRGEKR